MKAKKTTIQTDPETREKLRVLAQSDRRSMTNYLSVLVERDYQRLIAEQTAPTPQDKQS